MKFYKCGHILTTHGIKGDLKIKPLTDFDRFSPNNHLFILHQNNYVEVVVNKVSEFKENLLVSFKDLLDINLVEKYHGDDIYVSELDREKLSSNEFYYSDLIGKIVFNQKGDFRGEVIEIRELPHAKYLVVKYNDKTHLIPFISEFIDKIDEKIYIKEIEGLF